MSGPSSADPRTVTMAVTTAPALAPPVRFCACCRAPYVAVGRRRYCSDACRARAYRRRRQATAPPPLPAVPTGGRRVRSVYECPDCQERFLGEQRCPDCNRFCRRIGLGGECPHCGEAVAVADLIDPDP
jgi:hypothetical protein